MSCWYVSFTCCNKIGPFIVIHVEYPDWYKLCLNFQTRILIVALGGRIRICLDTIVFFNDRFKRNFLAILFKERPGLFFRHYSQHTWRLNFPPVSHTSDDTAIFVYIDLQFCPGTRYGYQLRGRPRFNLTGINDPGCLRIDFIRFTRVITVFSYKVLIFYISGAFIRRKKAVIC